MERKRKVDYRCRSPAEGMMAKQHPEAWKRVCEDDAKEEETDDE